MKYLEEFRNIRAIKGLAHMIERAVHNHHLTFMEVCGTHTMAIARFGIKELLPNNIRLLSGPGCPVCVTPNKYIDHAIALSRRSNTIIATFGDMMRVPGSSTSLEKMKSEGQRVEILYSPLDAIKLAKENPDKEVVFLSVGFETTVPTIASTIIMAKNQSIDNLSFLTANKTVPLALEALLQGDINLDGFILPGHVSTIIGAKAYEDLEKKYQIPCSVAGFEPSDILEAILDLVRQKTTMRPKLSIEYKRAVKYNGNPKAIATMNEVFEPTDSEWRGIGQIPGSGLKIRNTFKKYDAAKKFDVKIEETRETKGCICGQILQGLATPKECPLYRSTCTPENPIGACMVSSEGTCAAWYKYYT